MLVLLGELFSSDGQFNMLLKSLAKINIGLKILCKRNDGFHDIETIFYPINLFDEIDIDIKPSTKNTNSLIIQSDNPHVPKDKSNICFKVIANFFRTFQIKTFHKIKIKINKKIPIGGGLGGGSSNAAVVLKYLIKYFNIDISKNKKNILTVASNTGSDVTFFLFSKPCYATGKGDKITLLNDFYVDYDILLITPSFNISSKWAYESLKLPNDYRKNPILRDIKTFPKDLSVFENDFEKVVFRKYPELDKIKNILSQNGAVFTSLSGSGSTIYGFFERKNKNKLTKCADLFKAGNYTVNIV